MSVSHKGGTHAICPVYTWHLSLLVAVKIVIVWKYTVNSLFAREWRTLPGPSGYGSILLSDYRSNKCIFHYCSESSDQVAPRLAYKDVGEGREQDAVASTRTFLQVFLRGKVISIKGLQWVSGSPFPRTPIPWTYSEIPSQ